MRGTSRQKGIALYIVVAALALLGLVAAGTLSAVTQRASRATTQWNEAASSGLMGLALNTISPLFLQGGEVYNALKAAITQGLNPTNAYYLNPTGVQATAQSNLQGTGKACPQGSEDGGKYAWKAFIYLSPTATVCGKAIGTFNSTLEAARLQQGKERNSNNSPLQIYAFPILVGLEVTAHGTTSRTTFQGTYYAWVGPYHPGWWTIAAYGASKPNLNLLEVRGSIFTARAPALTLPYRNDAALVSSRCTSVSGGTSCTGAQQDPILVGTRLVSPNALKPFPWLICTEESCTAFPQGVDWGAGFQPFPTPTPPTPSIGNINIWNATTLTLEAKTQDNIPYLQIQATTSSGGSATYRIWVHNNNTYYCTTCNPGPFGIPFNGYINLNSSVTLNTSTLSVAPALKALRLTLTGPSFSLAGNLVPENGGCTTDQEGKTSCPESSLPLTIYATNQINVTASQIHANLIAPNITFNRESLIFGGLHFNNLSTSSKVRVYQNPNLMENRPAGFPSSSNILGALTFTGLVPGR